MFASRQSIGKVLVSRVHCIMVLRPIESSLCKNLKGDIRDVIWSYCFGYLQAYKCFLEAVFHFSEYRLKLVN